MTIVRPAPRLQPDDPAPALRALAAWVHWRHRDAAQARDQARAERDRYQQRARDAEARAPRADAPTSRLHELVERIVLDLGGPDPYADHIGSWSQRIAVDDVVAACRDIGQARAALERDQMTVRSSARRLREAIAGVDRADIRELAVELDDREAAS